MINGIVYGLICAAILSLFDVDEIFITSMQPFFKNIVLTKEHYYTVFAIIGAISGLFGRT